jgi:hypothetical protein
MSSSRVVRIESQETKISESEWTCGQPELASSKAPPEPPSTALFLLEGKNSAR